MSGGINGIEPAVCHDDTTFGAFDKVHHICALPPYHHGQSSLDCLEHQSDAWSIVSDGGVCASLPRLLMATSHSSQPCRQDDGSFTLLPTTFTLPQPNAKQGRACSPSPVAPPGRDCGCGSHNRSCCGEKGRGLASRRYLLVPASLLSRGHVADTEP